MTIRSRYPNIVVVSSIVCGNRNTFWQSLRTAKEYYEAVFVALVLSFIIKKTKMYELMQKSAVMPTCPNMSDFVILEMTQCRLSYLRLSSHSISH